MRKVVLMLSLVFVAGLNTELKAGLDKNGEYIHPDFTENSGSPPIKN